VGFRSLHVKPRESSSNVDSGDISVEWDGSVVGGRRAIERRDDIVYVGITW
jgi:hypothetical protein